MQGPVHYHLPNCDGRSCMCAVCTCGQHHCPGLMKSVPLEGNTHYRDNFTPKKAPRDDSPRRVAPPLMTRALPEHFKTTYQNQNEALGKTTPDRTQSCRPSRVAAPQAPFQGVTTQRADFPGHQPIIPPPPARPEPMVSLPGTYDTTLGAMQKPVEEALKNGNVQRPSLCKTEPIAVPQAPFNGITSYTDHYPPKASEPFHKASPRGMIPPVQDDNRDFQTTKSASYVRPPVSKLPPCPATFIPPQQPPSRDGHIKAPIEDEFRAVVASHGIRLRNI